MGFRLRDLYNAAGREGLFGAAPGRPRLGVASMDLALIVLLIKAFWVGVAVAAPMGPVGVYCIDRTLRDGLRTGLFAGLGAALADAAWAAGATYLVASLLGREKLESYRAEIFLAAFPVL